MFCVAALSMLRTIIFRQPQRANGSGKGSWRMTSCEVACSRRTNLV